MQKVQLYQPKLYDLTIDFPTEWNEFTTPELEAIAAIMISGTDNIFQAKSAMFIEILHLRTCDHQLIDKMNLEQLATDGLPMLDFVFLKNDLTKQPYPTLKIDNTIFVGPWNDFDNMMAGEYEDADIAYLKFFDDPAPAYLAELAATVYRPPNIPYTAYNHLTDDNITYKVEAVLPLFKNLPPYRLWVIYLWWTGCKMAMQKTFFTVYENSKATSTATDLMAFTKCIHAAAGAKNGTRDTVRRTLLQALLFDMEQEAVKAKEMEAAYKS